MNTAEAKQQFKRGVIASWRPFALAAALDAYDEPAGLDQFLLHLQQDDKLTDELQDFADCLRAQSTVNMDFGAVEYALTLVAEVSADVAKAYEDDDEYRREVSSRLMDAL